MYVYTYIYIYVYMLGIRLQSTHNAYMYVCLYAYTLQFSIDVHSGSFSDLKHFWKKGLRLQSSLLGLLSAIRVFLPRPWEDPKSRSTLVCNLHHRSIGVQKWGFYISDPPSRLWVSALVSVIMSSWRNDMGVYVVFANNIHHGSCMVCIEPLCGEKLGTLRASVARRAHHP